MPATLKAPAVTSPLAQEVSQGKGITLADLARTAKRAHNTLWRWYAEGLPVTGGECIKLEGIKLGREVLTSLAAYERFLGRLQASAGPDRPGRDVGRRPGRSRRRSDARK
jgi:hypothetical protein